MTFPELKLVVSTLIAASYNSLINRLNYNGKMYTAFSYIVVNQPENRRGVQIPPSQPHGMNRNKKVGLLRSMNL
jgi:hypothetical protein